MRHRSAIKLASHSEGIANVVVSQDGPISVVFRKNSEVIVRKNVKLVNMNMPWA